MTLSLPADLEPWTDEWHTPGVYALDLTLPRDLPRAWDQRYDIRPDFVDTATQATTVLYVGATADLLGRLEDHKRGDVRNAALVSLAEDVTLHSVWPFEDETRAFERESGIALTLDHETDAGTYVHQR